ncbi:MAG: HlyC/CorC family transporter [Ignavibacteria bacterium]|nr:HlyC/CorC family transporter [Ignavibacteria bacterium]
MLTQALLIFVLILVNAIFVVTEYAIIRVRTAEIDNLVSKGNTRAKLAKTIISDLDKYISATQLGITFVNLLLGWVGEDIFIHLLEPVFISLGISDSFSQTLAVIFGLLIITYFTITIGELAPKAFAIRKYLGATLWLSYPLLIFYKIFKPFIWLLNVSAALIIRLMGIKPLLNDSGINSQEEILQVIREGRKTGLIDQTEHQLIEKIFDFNDKLVKEIMVHRGQMVVLNIDDPRDKIYEIVTEEGYSRIPVYKDTIDNIIGIIYSKDLISASEHRQLISLNDIIRPAYFVNETKNIGILLREFQKQKVHIGIVVNEYGGVEGLVTMEDIIEEITGEIMDEYDIESPDIIKGKNQEYIVNPFIPVEEFNMKFNASLPLDKGYNTLGGFLYNVTGHIPSLYERIDYSGFTFIIAAKQRNTIKQVKVIKNA